MSSITKNRNYPVYASDDNSGTFLSFRTTIAGPGAGSALVMIDQDIADLYSSVVALQEEGSSVETISFTYQDSDGYYVGGNTALKTKAILIFSIDDNSKEVEAKLNVAGSGAKYLKRHDYQGNYINVLNSELVANKQYLTYFDGEYYMLVGCVVNEGDTSNMFVEESEAKERANIESGDTFKIAFGKLRKWFADFGSLVWKSSVGTDDIDNAAVTNEKQSKMAAATIKGNKLSAEAAPQDITVEEMRELLEIDEDADNTQNVFNNALIKDALADTDDVIINDSQDGYIKKVAFSVFKGAFNKIYAAINHRHNWDELDNIPTEFAPTQHTHDYSELTGNVDYEETDPTVPSWAKEENKPNYTAEEIGLGNVENVKQYSANNEPPYPVTSVNGHTGSVALVAEDIPYTEDESVWDKVYSMDIAQSSMTDMIGLKAEAEHVHVAADITDLNDVIAAAIAAIPVYDGTVS